jgi:hypothetical protein
MKESQLDEMLKEVPKERAPQGFTKRVLARADQPRTGGSSWPVWPALAFATVLLALLVPGGIWLWHQDHSRGALVEEISALRREHQRLTNELRTLRQQMSQVQPVIYIGSDERADYILDLRRLIGDRHRHSAARTEPAGGVPDPMRLPATVTGGSI